MKVKTIQIENILGITKLEITPGALTVIEGKNAAGKTSVLLALKDLAEGGHDPSLIRQGCEWGQVGMVLDDGVMITKKITAEKSTIVVRHPKMGRISRPQEWIRRVLDDLSLDPIQFLTVAAKDRLGILLGALDLKLDRKQLQAIVPREYLEAVKLDRHALEVIGDVRKRVFDKRRDVNVAAKEKRSSASQLVEALPDECPGGEGGRTWREELERLQIERDRLQEMLAARKAEIEGAKSREVSTLQETCDGKIEELRARLRDAVAAIVRQAASEIDKLGAEYEPQRDELNGKIGEAALQVENEGRVHQAREMIQKFSDDAADLEKRSDKLTKVLDALEELKAELLENLPIKGLEIRDGQIYVGGIPFDRLNDSERYRLAVEIGKLKAGELGLLLLDRAEIFDGDSWRAFSQAAIDSGLQVIAAKVTDSDLRVTEVGQARHGRTRTVRQ